MYEVMKATIVRKDKPVMTFDVNKKIKAGKLEEYRRRIKRRYVKAVMDEIKVDLQYKEVGENG